MKRASLLNLGDRIPQTDVIKLIWWNYLDKLDRQMVWIAHGSLLSTRLHSIVLVDCAKRGYLDLFIWLIENKNKVITINRVNQMLLRLAGIYPNDDDSACIQYCFGLFLDYGIKTRKSNILEWAIENGCQCSWKAFFCSCGWEKCLNLQDYQYPEDDIIWFNTVFRKINN